MDVLPAREAAPRTCDHTKSFKFAMWNFHVGSTWYMEDELEAEKKKNWYKRDLFVYESDTDFSKDPSTSGIVDGNYSTSTALVRNRYAYIFRQIEADIELHRELHIDDGGQIRITPPKKMRKPIKKRGDPADRGKSRPEYYLEFFHQTKRVRRYFILYSRIQLPMSAIEALEQARVEFGRYRGYSAMQRLMRPCVTWEKIDPEGSVYEYESCEVEPTHHPVEYFQGGAPPADGGEDAAPEWFAIGYDFLDIALHLSNEYRRALHDYQSRYVAPKGGKLRNYNDWMLASTIHSLVDESPDLKSKVISELRWSDLEDYLGKWRSRRLKRQNIYERAAARVCMAIDNPIYHILRAAYRTNEEDPSVENDQTMFVFNQYYGLTIRELGASKSGNSCLARQFQKFKDGEPEATATQGGPFDNYLGTYVFRDSMSDKEVFKTTRWSTKSTISIFSTFTSVYMQHVESVTAKSISSHLDCLFPNHKAFLDDPRPWSDDPVADELWNKFEIDEANVRFETRARGADGKITTITETVPVTKAERARLEKFANASADADLFKSAGRMIGIVFDSINAGLALNALRKKLGGPISNDWGREAMDATMHSLNLAKSVVEQVCGKNLSKSMSKSLPVVSAISAIYFCATDVYDANEALKVHDYDRAAALVGAAVGEAVAFVGVVMVIKATATGATAGPVGAILGLIGGLIAAVGYYLAMIGKDEAIETMLKHSTWGKHAFERDTDWVNTWQDGKTFDQWKGRPDYQLKALWNLIGAFTLERYAPGDKPEWGLLKNHHPPLKITFQQLHEDSYVKITSRCTMHKEGGITSEVYLKGDPQTITSEKFLGKAFTHRATDKTAPWLLVRYPTDLIMDVRKYHKKGYEVAAASMKVTLFLHERQPVGTASLLLAEDGYRADSDPKSSIDGGYNRSA